MYPCKLYPEYDCDNCGKCEEDMENPEKEEREQYLNEEKELIDVDDFYDKNCKRYDYE